MPEETFVRAFKAFAIGDAFGAPFEGMSKAEAERRLKHFESRGKILSDYTDDTIQMLLLAESLANTIYFSPSDFAERLRISYELGEIRRIGPTSSQALERLKAGYSWKDSGVDSNTCGSAMRVLPVGLLYSFDLNLVEEYSVLQSIVTHRNKEAIASSVAIALAYSCMLRGFDLKDTARTVVERVKAYDAYTTLLVERAFTGEFEYRGTALASDVVPAAIQCFLQSDSYEECLKSAVRLGGDTDSIAAMAGALKALEGCEVELSIDLDVDGIEKVEKLARKLWKVYEFIS